MAYINFKEENYKLKIQLEKRKKNNEKSFHIYLRCSYSEINIININRPIKGK